MTAISFISKFHLSIKIQYKSILFVTLRWMTSSLMSLVWICTPTQDLPVSQIAASQTRGVQYICASEVPKWQKHPCLKKRWARILVSRQSKIMPHKYFKYLHLEFLFRSSCKNIELIMFQILLLLWLECAFVHFLDLEVNFTFWQVNLGWVLHTRWVFSVLPNKCLWHFNLIVLGKFNSSLLAPPPKKPENYTYKISNLYSIQMMGKNNTPGTWSPYASHTAGSSSLILMCLQLITQKLIKNWIRPELKILLPKHLRMNSWDPKSISLPHWGM